MPRMDVSVSFRLDSIKSSPPTTCALVFKVCAEKGGRGDRPDMVINAWDSALGRWTLEELV